MISTARRPTYGEMVKIRRGEMTEIKKSRIRGNCEDFEGEI